MISSDQWRDITINTIKFVEVDENEEGNAMKSTKMAETMAKNVHDELQNEQNLQDMEQDKQDGEKEGGDGGSQQQDGSQISNASQNDDLRHLKDFKALISEKTVPNNIKILKRTVFFLLLVVVILTGVELGFKIQQSGDILEGVQAIDFSYKRHNIMADVNYNSRIIWAVANEFYTAATGNETYSKVK